MALKQTTAAMGILLQEILEDLEKGSRGNQAACQRVRTGTVALAKVAKQYRAESMKNLKRLNTLKKKAPAKKAKVLKKPVKAAKKRSPAKKKALAKR
ncbi:MAG: histone [Chlamydiota bacterium]|nr:histone [Chlamydiota bacterium]